MKLDAFDTPRAYHLTIGLVRGKDEGALGREITPESQGAATCAVAADVPPRPANAAYAKHPVLV